MKPLWLCIEHKIGGVVGDDSPCCGAAFQAVGEIDFSLWYRLRMRAKPRNTTIDILNLQCDRGAMRDALANHLGLRWSWWTTPVPDPIPDPITDDFDTVPTNVEVPRGLHA